MAEVHKADLTPLLLREAVCSLYLADAAGNPITIAPVWCGAAANRLRLGFSFEEQLSYTSGDAYKTAHHVDENHVIEIERTWLIQKTNPAATLGPQRSSNYVLEIVWANGRQWYRRIYYGVTGRSADLNSNGAGHSDNSQAYRAQRFAQTGGTGGPTIFTPIATVGNEQLVGFFGENALIDDSYLVGHYRWSAPKRITAARWAAWSPQVETVLGLELNGGLTGDEITIPAGVANTDDSDVVTLDRAVPASTEVRWKVLDGPAIESAAWHVGVVVTVVDG